MMSKKDNIFVRAKAYVKDHPRTSFQDAIQKVKGKKVSGTAKKPKAKVVVIAGVKKNRPRVVAKKVFSSAAKLNVVQRGQQIIHEIERLERIRSNQKDKTTKDFYSLVINKEHAKLKNLTKSIK